MDKVLEHYGDMLTEKIRESVTDFSKISDYDKFVLDNGYKYATKEELQAGYDRHWKASHNILASMEEFLAKAGKKKPSPLRILTRHSWGLSRRKSSAQARRLAMLITVGA